MPKYGVPQAGPFLDSSKNIVALQPRDSYKLFDAETVATGDASVAFNRGYPPEGGDVGVTFTLQWAAQPTASVSIQAANVDVDAAYIDLHQLQNNQVDYWTSKDFFQYWRVKVVSYVAGGALTVIATL